MELGNLRDAATSGCFWVAWLLLAGALLIPAPTASFGMAFLAVTCSVIPLAFGQRKQRIGAVVVLVLSLAVAFSMASKAKSDPYFKKQRKNAEFVTPRRG
jgi:threonine/homoserine efflux transporter RhtA